MRNLILCFTISVFGFGASAEMWRGLEVRSEHRCAPYSSEEYRYSQSVEDLIIRNFGGHIYGPYTGSYFASKRETDIEHIVARSEAHDSGLCSASASTKRAFANDLLNLTLANPAVNRHQKVDKDAAQWLPLLNKCWYVNRVIQVRQKYRLSIDRREATAIDAVLRDCDTTAMVVAPPRNRSPKTAISRRSTPTTQEDSVLAQYDDNGNGRITCKEARNHGIAPVSRSHPAYRYMNDADGDGVVCE